MNFAAGDRSTTGQADSPVLIVTENEKRFLVTPVPGQRFHCHIGIIEHDALIGMRFGTVGTALSGQKFLLLEPSLSDLMLRLKRATQIIYPKDAAYLIQRLNLRCGSLVLEAGTGSGALTTALAWTVAPLGKVISVEGNPEMHRLAEANLVRTGVRPWVELHQGYLEECGIEQAVDAVMLDMRSPWRAMEAAVKPLKCGGAIASFLPTTNQVSEQLTALEACGCTDIAVEEVLIRRYKPVPERLRPEDRMTAHTGYIVSARKVHDPENASRWLSRERLKFLDREEARRRYMEKKRRQPATAARRPALP